MSNDQAQTPAGGSNGNDQNKSKTKNENNKNHKSYNKSNNIYGVNLIMASSSDTSSQKIEGEESSIGVVLGLCVEKLIIKYPSISSEKYG